MGYLSSAAGSRWKLVGSWVYSADVPSVAFLNLLGYSEIHVTLHSITHSIASVPRLTVSDDNGVTYRTTSGDYVSTAGDGTPANDTGISLWTTNSTNVRSGSVIIRGFRLTGLDTKHANPYTRNTFTYFSIPGAAPLNALKITPSGGGNITGGHINVFGRR